MDRARDMTSHTWQLARQTPQAHKYSAPDGPGDWILYGGAYRLWVLSAEPGSCHSPGTWSFKLASNIYGKSVHLGVASFLKDCCTGIYEGLKPMSQAVWTVNAFLSQVAWHVILCVSVNIPSGAKDAWNANSMLRILCRFSYKCVFRQGGYMCCKLSTQS